MGIVQFTRLRCHRLKTNLYNCSLCPNVMNKREFFLIHRFLHFSDNRSANLEDKLYKIRRLFDLLSLRFQRFYMPSREITLDERIVKHIGRVSFLQYIRNKPNQYGLKIYVVADAHNGFVYNWKIYTGRDVERGNRRQRHNDGERQQVSERSTIYPVVQELTNNLINYNHVLCFDSFYAYLDVIKELTRRNVGCVGSLDRRRRLIPFEIKILIKEWK